MSTQQFRSLADIEYMTPPRYVVPGQTVFVTLRAVGRSFRFLPTRQVRELIDYALAVMSEEHGILLHEFEFLSNHGHLLLTDVRGVLPDFMRDLGSLVSRSLNAHRGHCGTNIEKGYNIVRPVDEDKCLEHAVYTLANACTAHLVRRTKHWKGTSSFRMRYGEPVQVRRPKVGMWKYEDKVRPPRRLQRKRMNTKRARQRRRSKLPEVAHLVLVRPPMMEHLSDKELRAEILMKLDVKERSLIEERAKKGKSVMGMRVVLAQSWEASPRSREDMFTTVPRFSGRSKWARIEAAQRRAEFEGAYAMARDDFRSGERSIEFPVGTWWMRRCLTVLCRPPPT